MGVHLLVEDIHHKSLAAVGKIHLTDNKIQYIIYPSQRKLMNQTFCQALLSSEESQKYSAEMSISSSPHNLDFEMIPFARCNCLIQITPITQLCAETYSLK